MEEYTQMMSDIGKYGSLALSMSMAHETGIIHALCQADKPLTSTQVAQQAGLKERYVRELLGSLVAGEVVQLAPGTGERGGREAHYVVPEEQRAVLNKTALKMAMLGLTARQYGAVSSLFPADGPSHLPFNSRVFDVLDGMFSVQVDTIFSGFFKVPGLREKLESGIDVAELGCGSGWMSLKLAAMFPKSRFTVTDVVQLPLDKARQVADDQGLTNVTTKVVDACNPPDDWNEKFDWITTCSVIHDLPHPKQAVEGVRKALKPGGIFSMLDTCFPSYVAENVGDGVAAMYYLLSTCHCIPESYQQPDSEALGACWGEDLARETVEGAGLKLLEVVKPEALRPAAIFNCMKPA